MSGVVAAAAAATRLLIVEDDHRYARVLGELLTSGTLNLEIAHVTRIDEACHRVDSGDVDLVVLDLGLPDAEGLQSLAALQGCVTEIPVVVLTGRADEELALDALKRGAEDYLVKDDITPDLLDRSIRYARERRRALRAELRLRAEQSQRAERSSRPRCVSRCRAWWNRASAAPAAQACRALVNGSHDSASRYRSIPAARACTS